MINIIYSIILFNVLIIIFKMFDKYNINSLQALIFNYITAGICSYLFLESNFSIESVINAPWLLHAVSIGILFMIVFIFYACGTQKVGIAITTIANKMSLIIPVSVAIILYNDTFNYLKALAFCLGIIGIYLCSTESGKLSFDKKYLWLIILVFLGQGISDSIFNDFAQSFSNQIKYIFFMVLFFVASISGIIIHSVKSFKKYSPYQTQSILWGFLLGLPNFFCLVFFLKALETSNLQSSTVFSLVSIGIVIVSSLLGILIFNERLSKTNWVGILISMLSIYIFSY